MKIILAPDKFKGSLSGLELLEVMKEALIQEYEKCEIHELSIADGGDGFLDIFATDEQFVRRKAMVHDPLMRPISAEYLIDKKNKRAVIESAEASGLRLLKPSEIDSLRATSYGIGELIAHAIGEGAEEILLGIGGSAFSDGGAGMAHALGYRFLDTDGVDIFPYTGDLHLVYKLLAPEDPIYKNLSIKVACDVDNPLLGQNGSAAVYSPQKGASPSEVEQIEMGLQHLNRLFVQQLDIDVSTVKGAGAAGGLGGGAMAFLAAKLVNGVDLVFEAVNFDYRIKNADAIIFAEGKVDDQSFMGKPLGEIIKRKDPKTKVLVVCGQCDLNKEEWRQKGIHKLIAIMDLASDEDEAYTSTAQLVTLATKEVLSL